MTAPGRYAASDNSFTKSTATAAARGGILVVVAIVIGVLLLWQGFDSGDPITTDEDDSDETADDMSSEETTPTDTAGDDADETPADETTSTTTTAAAPIVLDPPNLVKVAVLNGRGETGLAGTRRDHLTTEGYVAIAANADTNDKQFSRVYYTPGYEDEAVEVAVALTGSPLVIEMAPLDPLTLVAEDYRETAADYHIYVVLGADEVLG